MSDSARYGHALTPRSILNVSAQRTKEPCSIVTKSDVLGESCQVIEFETIAAVSILRTGRRSYYVQNCRIYCRLREFSPGLKCQTVASISKSNTSYRSG